MAVSDAHDGQSFKETAYAVHCPKHGKVFLTSAEYHRQLMKYDDRWYCPVIDVDPADLGLCGRISEFDDDNFEAITFGKDAQTSRKGAE